MQQQPKQAFETQLVAGKVTPFFDWKELWRYRNLLLLWVKKDWTAGYKQTVLGPAWAVIQPIVSTLVYTVVFGGIAKLTPEGIPAFLYFMAGQILWTFFSTTLQTIGNTYVDNAYILSKVYFPRAVLALVTLLSRLIAFGIHFVLFLIIYGIGMRQTGFLIQGTVWLLPLMLVHLGALALGVGLLLASINSYYRDFYLLQAYFVTLWMYLTPIVYDAGLVPERLQTLYLLNPVTPVILLMRHAFFAQPMPSMWALWISVAQSIVILLLGVYTFRRTERTFIDTM